MRTAPVEYQSTEIENEDFLSRQLITYLGNKRRLLPFIAGALDMVKKKLRRQKLTIFDAFSGSGAVARFFKAHAQRLLVNDLEAYSQTVNRCYLANVNELPLREMQEIHVTLCRRLQEEPLRKGFIAELYAPCSERRITCGERVFYTPRNARFIDTARQYIETVPSELQHFFIAPLLAQASVHVNTAGIFKGFYKNRNTGKGHFGGVGSHALTRIMGDITLPFPVWSAYSCPVTVFCEDTNTLVIGEEIDLAYFDPPYNQHPYGSNYFMLNLIVSYQRPALISPISGIPSDWNRSVYNKRHKAQSAFEELVDKTPAKFLLVSFNSEGFISFDDMCAMLKKTGTLTVLETSYHTFRGSRNLYKRPSHVQEYLFLVER